MPALVNIRVGSLRGTSGDDGTHLVALAREIAQKGRPDLVDAAHPIHPPERPGRLRILRAFTAAPALSRKPGAAPPLTADRHSRYKQPPPPRAAAPSSPARTSDMTATTAPRPAVSRLEEALRARRFVITTEITPPVSFDPATSCRKADAAARPRRRRQRHRRRQRPRPTSLPRSRAALLVQPRHRADPAADLPRPQPDRAAGRPHGRGRDRRPATC